MRIIALGFRHGFRVIVKEMSFFFFFYNKLLVFSVHIRRTDKVNRESALHELEEYMYHVEDYYKIKRLDGGVDKKRIYLATDEPTLFDEAKRK